MKIGAKDINNGYIAVLYRETDLEKNEKIIPCCNFQKCM